MTASSLLFLATAELGGGMTAPPLLVLGDRGPEGGTTAPSIFFLDINVMYLCIHNMEGGVLVPPICIFLIFYIIKNISFLFFEFIH